MAKIIKLTESDLRRIVKKVIKEQSVLGTLGNAMEIYGGVVKNLINTIPAVTLANMAQSAISGDAKSFNQAIDQEKARLGNDYNKLKNAVTKGDIAKNLQNIGSVLQPYVDQFKSGMGNQPQSRPSSPVAKSTTGGVQKPGPAGPMKTPRPKAGIQTNPNASGGAQSSGPTALANQQKKSPYIAGGL